MDTPIIFLDIDGVISAPVAQHAFHKAYIKQNKEVIKKAKAISKKYGYVEYTQEDPRHLEAKEARAAIRELYDYSACSDGFGQLFSDRPIRHLKYILDNTGAKIVISSSWRDSGLSIMQEMWKERQLPGEVIGVTCYPSEVSEEVKTIDAIPSIYDELLGKATTRGHEIKQWCIDNSINKYVILDDESGVLVEQADNFVCTIGKWGLMKKHAIEAVKILKR